MTVTTLNASTTLVGDGTTGPFAITFQYMANNDISVYLRTIADGSLALQSTPSQYSLGTHETGALDGEVTFVSAVSASYEIVILRTTPLQQSIDLTPSTVFPSASVEEALDRMTMRLQEMSISVESRVVRAPAQDEASGGGGYPDMELPVASIRSNGGLGGTYMGFDEDGEPTVIVGTLPGDATVTAYGQTLINLDDSDDLRETEELVHDAGSVSSIAAGVVSARPASEVFGSGLYWATDELRLYYSLGTPTSWQSVTISQIINSDVPTSGFVLGRLFLDVHNNEILRDNGASLDPIEGPWCRGDIGGLGLSRASVTTITIQPGQARSIEGAYGSGRNLTLPSATTKTLSTADTFAVGTGQPGNAPTVAIGADAWYYAFLVGTAEGAVDVAFDDNISGTNITATGQIKTAGYDQHFRYIGRFRTDSGSQIVDFLQDGDHFRLKAPTVSHTDSVLTDYTGGVDRVLSHSPEGCLTDIGWLTETFIGGGEGLMIMETDQASAVPVPTAAPGILVATAHSSVDPKGRMVLRANSSAQIHIRTTAGAATLKVHIVTHGWWDDRGRNM